MTASPRQSRVQPLPPENFSMVRMPLHPWLNSTSNNRHDALFGRSCEQHGCPAILEGAATEAYVTMATTSILTTSWLLPILALLYWHWQRIVCHIYYNLSTLSFQSWIHEIIRDFNFMLVFRDIHTFLEKLNCASLEVAVWIDYIFTLWLLE